MPKIQLTNGRRQVRYNGDPHYVGAAELAVLQQCGRDLVKAKRGDGGLPDGYLILDEVDHELASEWVGLNRT